MKKALCLTFCILLIMSSFIGCTNHTPSLSNRNRPADKSKISQDVVRGNSLFAFDIFKALNKEDEKENIFISPISISTALTMTYQGARNTTKEAMAETLGYSGIDDEKLNESYQNLLGYLEKLDKKIELNINNSIWVREGESIKEDFISTNENIFYAPVTPLDFSKESAADEINKWISKATKEKIDKMIEPPIAPNVIMYLINAIYFKGDWAKQFDKNHTFTTEFHLEDGDSHDVMMMSRKGKVEYGEGDDFKAVRLPYGKGKASMYCILPEEGTSIDDFIADLDADKWATIKDNISETDDVLLQLPRFKLEYGIKNLNDVLIALGMEEAFTDRADFSGIRENICISRVLHKAVIEVNEEGSEAAAATVVEMKETAFIDPITFIADRPFVFLIADDETGTILFMGKLYDMSN